VANTVQLENGVCVCVLNDDDSGGDSCYYYCDIPAGSIYMLLSASTESLSMDGRYNLI